MGVDMRKVSGFAPIKYEFITYAGCVYIAKPKVATYPNGSCARCSLDNSVNKHLCSMIDCHTNNVRLEYVRMATDEDIENEEVVVWDD
jgi:hypothetical protein